MRVGQTINEFSEGMFLKYKQYRVIMLTNVIDICKYMKYNMVIEVGMIPYDNMYKMINKSIPDNNWYYIGYNYSLNTQRFILKNVLKRNIETGRLLNYNTVSESFNNMSIIIDTYKSKLPKNNLILIEQGYVMPNIMPLTTDQISRRTLTSEIKFMEDYDAKCNGVKAKFNLTNPFENFKTFCVVKKLYRAQDLQNIKKDIGTDSNTKYLFDENTSALIILNTFDQLQQSIKQIIDYYNTLPDIPQQLVEADIKVVLKGGLNIRLYLKKLIVFIENTIETKKTTKPPSLEQSKSISKLLDFFKDFEKENTGNVFENIITKSDLDFTVVMNKSKFNKEKYDLVKKLIFTYAIDYFQRLKKVLTDTQFFGTEYILKSNLKNIYQENSDKINTIEYDGMEYNSVDDKITVIPSHTIYNSSFQYTASDLHFNNNDNLTETEKKYVLKPSSMLKKLTTIPSPDIMNELNRFTISYSNNINFKSLKFNNQTEKFETKNESFDLARIKNGYYINDRHALGEIIDLAIVSYDLLEQSTWDNIETVNYSNNFYNYNINIFNLEYLTHDLESILFEKTIFPWENKKYLKRINRYIIIKIFNVIIKANSSKDLDNIIDELSWLDKNIDKLKQLNNTDKLKKSYIFYKLFLLLNESKKRIKLILTNLPEIEKLLRLYNYDPTTYDFNNYYLQGIDGLSNMYNNFKKGINIMPKYIRIIKDILDKSDYKKKNLLFNDRYKYTIEQYGGYKKSYEIAKQFYLMLKGGALDIRPLGLNFAIFNNAGKNLMEYNRIQYDYLTYFISDVLPDVQINNIPFTAADIANIRALAAGSFGTSVLIDHTPTRKKFIMKIIGNEKRFIPNTPPVGTPAQIAAEFKRRNNMESNFIKDILKESYTGFGLTQQHINLPNFNQSYAYFKASNDVNDPYFKSADPSFFKYVGNIDNNNRRVLNGNLFIIFIDAGEGSLYEFIPKMKSNSPAAPKNEYYDNLLFVLKELLNIKNLNITNPITKNTVYITHNDIKPPNAIFKQNYNTASLKYSYKVEYIDYGGMVYASTFFTKLNVSTPFMYKIIYFNPITNRVMFDRMQFTSPIYDICSAILSVLIMIIGWDEGTIQSILNPLKLVIYKGSVRLNTIITDTVDNKFPLLLQNKFGSDFTQYDINITKKFIQKLIPYLLLLASLTMHLASNEAIINSDFANNYKNLEFTDFKLVKIKLDPNSNLTMYDTVITKEKNIDAINKIIYMVKLMSDTI
jgi:hypothetical protein